MTNWIGKVAIAGLAAIVAAGFVLGGRGGRAQVEYDFRTLPLPLRQQAWHVYDHGTPDEKYAMHEALALGGYDAAARHFT